jgi:hypothetical protein
MSFWAKDLLENYVPFVDGSEAWLAHFSYAGFGSPPMWTGVKNAVGRVVGQIATIAPALERAGTCGLLVQEQCATFDTVSQKNPQHGTASVPSVPVRRIGLWFVAISLALPFSCCIGGRATWKGWSALHPEGPLPAGALADFHRHIQAEIDAGNPDPGDPERDEAYQFAATPLLIIGFPTLLCSAGLALLVIVCAAFRRQLPRGTVVVVAAATVITFILTALGLIVFAYCEARVLLVAN